MKVQFFSQAIDRFFSVLTAVSLMILVGCLPAGSESSTKNEQLSKEAYPEKNEDKDSTSRLMEDEPEEDFLVYPPLDESDAVTFLTQFGAQTKGSEVNMQTKYGSIVVRLYDDTPLHRANFLYLIERDYFNPTTIVRVVPDFVIQGGNSEEQEDRRKRALIGSYTLPPEFRPNHIHKRGALAMSRSYIENSEKRSSAYDFYIVLGQPLSQTTLYTTSLENKRAYTDDQKEIYTQRGGAPHLDNEHTVFGEVIQGMDVVERISRVDRDASDWPREHIEVRMELSK